MLQSSLAGSQAAAPPLPLLPWLPPPLPLTTSKRLQILLWIRSSGIQRRPRPLRPR